MRNLLPTGQLCISTLIASVYGQCWLNTSCIGPSDSAFPGPWESNIFSPDSRTVVPDAVLTWPALASQDPSSAQTLTSNGSLLVFDFGKEVGGLVSLNWNSTGSGSLGLAFSEARNFIGFSSDDSNGAFKAGDGALYTPIYSGAGMYSMPAEKLRGGFRYMSIFLLTNDTSTSVSLEAVTTYLDFAPTWPNLRAYQGYFNCSDPLLNRIWYAGAYTLQSNMVPTDTGRQVPFLQSSWANNATLGPGETIIVDGAKRDRAVWPGDMGIAAPSAFVSLGDLEPVKNALQVMYDTQNHSTGAFDESGPPLSQKGSDTYHMWTMIGTYNYHLYTADDGFLTLNWPGYQNAMSYILAKLISANANATHTNTLLNVTGTRDWGRFNQGGQNSAANILLYGTLVTGAKLAAWQNDSTTATNWTTLAADLARSITTTTLFDPATNSFKDNTTSSLHPQDANALSLYFQLPFTNPPAISTALTNNWSPIGPLAPELPNNISPFITSFELIGRLASNTSTAAALSLLRTTWGWILHNPHSTQSTLLEGYLANASFSYRNNDGYHFDESYVSHAHGWSAGPTSALTNYVLGLDVVAPAGRAWRLVPRVGDLQRAEGGFVTGLGTFQAGWEVEGGCVVVWWATPMGTRGLVGLSGGTMQVVDGGGGRMRLGLGM